MSQPPPLPDSVPFATAVTLPYAADVATRLGITVETSPAGVRYTLAAPSFWRFHLVPILAALFFSAYLGLPVALSRDPAARIGPAMVSLVVFGLAVTRVVQFVRTRWFDRMSIDLANGWLVTRGFNSFHVWFERRWPAAEVASITPGPVPWLSGNVMGHGLHVRIRGKEIAEVMGGQDSVVAKWLADALTERLKGGTRPL